MPSTIAVPARRTVTRGYAFAVAITLIWAAFSLSGRHAALSDAIRLTPWDLGALRYTVAGGAAGAMWLAGYGRGLPWRRALATAAFAGLGFPLPSYLGFTYAPAAHGAVILSGALPFMVAAGNWLLYREPWTRQRLISLLVLLAGVLLLGIEAYGQGARPGAWRGDLLFMAGSVSWAIYTMMARSWGASPPQAIVAVGLWSAVLYLPLWWLLLPSNLAAAPVGEVVYQAIFQGVFAVVISLYLFTRALAAIGAARLSMVTALVPGVAGLLAIPILGEDMGPLALTGLALVCAAVALGVRRA